MIAALLVALQLAAASPSLVVRDAHRSMKVPVISSADGPMVAADGFGTLVPIRVHRQASGMYSLDVWDVHMEVEPGTPVVRVGDEARPLAVAPTVQRGRLLIPLQMVSEVFPGLVPNVRWDADTKQLLVFGDVAATHPAAPRDGSAASRGATDSGAGADDNLPPVPAKHFRRTVIVDAGHGGVDNGMSGPLGGGPKIYEKNITLAVAKKLGEALERRGVDVVYTRTTDTLIALDDRGRIANRAKGDLFISIHVNAANPNWKNPGGSRGFETYFLSEARTEDARRVEQMENAAVRFEQAPKVDKADPLSFILSDMTQNEHLRESSELAETIQHALAKMHPGPSRGVKQAGFRVLVTAYMPAVLVEVGFGTNPREAAYLSSADKQSALAETISGAAMDYLERYERRVAGAGASDGGGAR